ncbi:MAG: hypothetical protein IPK46_15235 [Saprospiraceae bacterium]|nr:hypothetical protein [Saprospiraceae bacterium]
MINHQNAPTYKMFSWVRNLVPIHVLSAFFLLFLSHLSIAQTVITYNYTGSMQTYTVPPGVYSINISASGAQGAGGAGGNGGQATGDLNVTPGQILNIFVGGQDGYNGGGSGYAAVARNGGGASDVRITGTSRADRIIVGGGGGGGGFTDVEHVPVVPEEAEPLEPITPVEAEVLVMVVLVPQAESAVVPEIPPAIQVGPAAVDLQAVEAVLATLAIQAPADKTDHSDKAVIQIPGKNGICYNSYGGTNGGGGGYYGGGGTSVGNCGGGGGGGGSSWTGTLANPTFTAGFKTGNGIVIITQNENYIAQIMGGASYLTLQDAINAAAENDTIVLLANVTEDIVIPTSVSLDANGYDLSIPSSLQIATSKTLTWMSENLNVNVGASILNDGTLCNNGNLNYQGGLGSFTNTGIYKGTGSFNGNFINAGSVRPGN